jgi:hypothetical protein
MDRKCPRETSAFVPLAASRFQTMGFIEGGAGEYRARPELPAELPEPNPDSMPALVCLSQIAPW